MLSSAIGPIFDILSFSTIIVLVVIGLGVIASMMGVFNFAHGEFVTIGAYTTYLAHTLGAPVWFGMMLAPIVAGLFGLILEIAIVRRLYQNPVAAMLATWAVGLAMRETVRILTAGLYISVPEPITGSIVLGATSVSAWRCVIMAITVLVVLGSWLLLSKTSFGLQVRAALENPALARSSGLSTSVIYCATFTFGTALAGLAGALIVPVYSLFADLGLRFVIQGFVSILIGGLGSFTGPSLGGSIIGVFGSGMPWVISPVTTDILMFVLAIMFAKFRPGGLSQGKGV